MCDDVNVKAKAMIYYTNGFFHITSMDVSIIKELCRPQLHPVIVLSYMKFRGLNLTSRFDGQTYLGGNLAIS